MKFWLWMMLGGALWITPLRVRADGAEDGAFLLDKVIRWADGTSEHVQVDRDGFFHLDGKLVRLVGIDIGTTGLAKPYYSAESLAVLDKELAYLEASGFRVIHATFGYEGYGKEAKSYKPLLDLLYKHKMLAFPLIAGKWLPNFGNLANADFRIGEKDSLSQWATRWCAVMSLYPNVVAVAAENELDSSLKPPLVPAPQKYTAADAAAYIKLLTTIVRAELHVPVVTKLMGEVNASWQWRPDIKEALLPLSDTPCFDVYFPTVQELNKQQDALLTWLKHKGRPTRGIWIAEANAGTGNEPRSADFSTAYLETMFAHGSSLVCLWVANRVKNPGWSFFDSSGIPGEPLSKIAADLPRLQAPVKTRKQ
jgi:hypothetical protein